MAKIDITKTELVWPGKYNEDGTRKEVPRVSLPFQVIETVNESRATREVRKLPQQTLFDVYEGKEGDTFEAGWRKKSEWVHFQTQKPVDLIERVIVYQRLEKDFASNSIFRQLPLVPPEWRPFEPKVILRGEATEPDATGNLFLTNIHQLYESRDKEWTPQNAVDALLGRKPVKDLAAGQRSMLERVKSLKNLVVLNDEAHHVHDEKLAWSKSLIAVHRTLPKGLGLWLDFSATPKDQNGMYFPWTVCDYPLAQAVEDRIVKAPLIVTKEDDPKQPTQDPENVTKDNVAEKYGYWLRAAVQRWKDHWGVYKKLDTKPRLEHDIRKLSDLAVAVLKPVFEQEELAEVYRVRLKLEFATTETEVHQAEIGAGELPPPLESDPIRSHLSRLEIQEGIAKYLARKIAELIIDRRAIEFERADYRLSETKPFGSSRRRVGCGRGRRSRTRRYTTGASASPRRPGPRGATFALTRPTSTHESQRLSPISRVRYHDQREACREGA